MHTLVNIIQSYVEIREIFRFCENFREFYSFREKFRKNLTKISPFSHDFRVKNQLG
jgi:hypothetical protein